MAALQVGFQDQLADMGAADDHRFEQRQAATSVAPLGDQGGERPPVATPQQHDPSGAADARSQSTAAVDALCQAVQCAPPWLRSASSELPAAG